MTIIRKRWPWITLAVLLCAVGVSVIVYRELNRRWQEMLESKFVRTTQATVIRKEEFQCDKAPCFYLSGYDDWVEMKPGETQRRIYYQIDNFDRLNEPRRSRALQAENNRVETVGARFTYAEDWYDTVAPGMKIYVRYRCFSDGKIEVWGVDTKP